MIFVSQKRLSQAAQEHGSLDFGTLLIALHELEQLLPPETHPYVTEEDVVAAAQLRSSADYLDFVKRLGIECRAGAEWVELWDK